MNQKSKLIRLWQLLVLAALAPGFLCGCIGGQVIRGYSVATGGYPHRGAQLIAEYRCGACHMIPGIPDASGVFGPPLTVFGRRTYIAGQFTNTADNLTHWIMSPTSLKPKTAMPDLGVSEQQARDIASYLYTLK